MGEMTRAPHLIGENPMLEGSWQFTGSMRKVWNPAVLCGAWTIPSQHRTLLLFANYSASDVPLTIDYPIDEWGLKDSRYEVARYDKDGIRKPLEALPQQLVFRSDEAFVLELTKNGAHLMDL